MRIGLTYDLKGDWEPRPGDPVDANAELDRPETVDAIAAAFESAGHEVRRIGHAENLLAQIDRLDVDIVFNICEGHSGRNRESQVPVILEMKGIPFVGSDGLTLGVTLDKVVAKKCFIADRIPTPRFFVAPDSREVEQQNTIGFPLIVKTLHEGTSKGLTEHSRVTDLAGLKRQVEIITSRYHQPALVEEFIQGTEFTVAVLGNGRPQAMPVVQIKLEGSLELGEKFFTFQLVQSENHVEYVCPAPIAADLERRLHDLAVRTYRSVGCRDFGRVDFRVDERGNPYVLEVNPLPSLNKKDIFNVFPRAVGTTYNAVLNQVLKFALERYGIPRDAPALSLGLKS